MSPVKLILTGLLAAGVTTPAWSYEPAGTPPDWESPIPEPKPYWKILGDRLETGFSNDVDTYVWDVQGWYGGDRNRVWVTSEGEGEQGKSPENAEVQVLYSRLIAPFWDWQVGIRHDVKPTPDRTHFTVGLQGLAPYEFEFNSALFVSDEGAVTTRIEAEYDLNITQRWVLRPRLELNASFSDDLDVGLAKGINSTEFGVRLSYQIRREIAPYFGVSWEQLYGDTRDLARAEGEPGSLTSVVLGVRIWF